MGCEGSIGTIGSPNFDSHNKRVKGFCTSVITSPDMAYSFIEEARQLRDKEKATRVTLRFVTDETSYKFVKDGDIYIPKQSELYHSKFETKPIPLRGEKKGYYVIYFGENDLERIEHENIISKEENLVAECKKSIKYRNPFTRAKENGYNIEKIENGNIEDCDIKRAHVLFGACYKSYTFDLTKEDNVSELLRNKNSIITLARNSKKDIVSIAIAEVAEIPTDRGLIRISELSDEATHPKYRGNGLNQACVATLVQELLEKYNDDIHLIFEEDRATSRGVNQQSCNLGFQYSGRLNRHCMIKADSDIVIEGPYEDLNVWYLE